MAGAEGGTASPERQCRRKSRPCPSINSEYAYAGQTLGLPHRNLRAQSQATSSPSNSACFSRSIAVAVVAEAVAAAAPVPAASPPAAAALAPAPAPAPAAAAGELANIRPNYAYCGSGKQSVGQKIE